MDLQSAKRFKTHLEDAIKELSSGLVLVRETSGAEEFTAVRKSVGDIIARIDNLLHDAVYSEHPELNEHRDRPVDEAQ